MEINNGKQLTYSVSYNGQTMVEPSQMGFELVREKAMGGDFRLLEQPKVERKTDNWTPVVALKHKQVKAEWNEATLRLQEDGRDYRRMDLQVRVYNDGVAFRYQLFDRHQIGQRYIQRECTDFTIPAGSNVWMGRHKGRYKGSQETEFYKFPIDSVTQETVALLPFLVEVNKNAYMALMDANVDDYPGYFIGARKPRVLTTKLAPMPEPDPKDMKRQGQNDEGIKARFFGSKWTPWRVLMIADNAGKLIESEIIRNLNPECAIKDPSWIKPGMSAWDHWWSGEVKMEMPVLKEYIDFAAAQGWPYMLVDWQWYGKYNKSSADPRTTAEQIDMPELVQYAKERNVRLWVWLYCTDITHNSMYDEAFALFEKWGLAGVKIDFMDRMDQDMTRWYRLICQKAAEHHLMVDFHGAYRPDGIERTYPNLLTREGVLGEEYYKFSTRMTPEHNTTLPFTRMLAGPMDYTPGGFLNDLTSNLTAEELDKMNRNKSIIPARVFNTRAAELSKFIIYESPYMVVSDHPKHILGQPGADFLKVVSTTWDDTRFLGGYPGEYCAIARQKDGVWYIGVLNNSQRRRVQLDLSELPGIGTSLEYWADTKKSDRQPTMVEHKTVKLNMQKPLTIDLAAAGGYVAIVKQ